MADLLALWSALWAQGPSIPTLLNPTGD
jgi:hypothetical protein